MQIYNLTTGCTVGSGVWNNEQTFLQISMIHGGDWLLPKSMYFLTLRFQLKWNICWYTHHHISTILWHSTDTTAPTRRALSREHAQFDGEGNSRLSDPVQLTRPCDPQKTTTHTQTKKKTKHFSFTWRGVSWHRFHTMRPWHGLQELHALAGAGISFPPLKLCKGPAVTQGRSILGWSAWVPRERLEIILTGWTQFLPIPAFQWSSYFWVMLYTAAGAAERNTTQLEENGGMTHLTLYEVLQPGKGAKNTCILHIVTVKLLAGEQG